MRAAPRAASAWPSEAAGSPRPPAFSAALRPSAGARSVIERIVRSVDFERVLRTRSRLSSVHFAVHHLAEPPARAFKARPPVTAGELSTGLEMQIDQTVDDSLPTTPSGVWLGAVVPKRHARRAVTRTLLKRQIRSVVAAHGAQLDAGLWVVRLRAPFDRATFVSAASDALRHAARAELDGLLATAVRRSAAARA